MQQIIIEKINKEIAEYLIFGTTVESPLFQLEKISKKLNNNCIVLFDQLLQTGDIDNRFLTIEYKNNKFDLSTARNIDSNLVGKNIRMIVASFLKNNEALLKYSILVSEQKEIIRNGGMI